MALVKDTLKAELVVMLTAMVNETNQTASVSKFADKLATAIDNYIKTGTVTGTCATPSGAGTIAGIIV